MTSSIHYQSQECLLYGSVLDSHTDLLIQRLKGLADPDIITFYEQEIVFSLKTGTSPDVTVRLRRKLEKGNSDAWHFRYIGTPEPIQKCPTIVRKTIDSLVYSADMMEFVKALGLRFEYEFMVRGHMFTKGRLKISVAKLLKSEVRGMYEDVNLKPLSNSKLVEISTSLPDGDEYMTAAKSVRDFADQLRPICELQKCDYLR